MPDLETELSTRLGRSFDEVQDSLCELFDTDWDDVLVIVETSAHKTERSTVDVIVDLMGRTEQKPTVRQRVRKGVIQWIGKPWRERANPWDRFKDRLPEVPDLKERAPDDLDEWAPRQFEDGGGEGRGPVR